MGNGGGSQNSGTQRRFRADIWQGRAGLHRDPNQHSAQFALAAWPQQPGIGQGGNLRGAVQHQIGCLPFPEPARHDAGIGDL